jgi:hypothetical protein
MYKYMIRTGFLVTLACVALIVSSCNSAPPTPQAPQANDDRFEMRTGATLDVPGPGLLANDVGESMTVTSVNGVTANVGLPTATAESGTLTVQTNGALHYVPAGGFKGTDTFSYGVSNPGGEDDANASVLVTDPWTPLAAIPTPVSRAAGVFWDGRFYVIGGEAAGGARDGLVQVYDPATDEWTVLPDTMVTGVANHCAVVLGDAVYVPGGYTGTVGVSSTQVLDLVNGTWSVDTAAELPEARYAHSCTTMSGKIYLFGGGATGDASDTVWLYEPSLPAGSRWVTTLATMPSTIAYSASVTVGERIFVAGFSSPATGAGNDSDAVWEYTPGTDAWRTYPSLLTARGAAGMWTDGVTLFVGGGGWSTPLATVEAYDLSQGTGGTWITSDPMVDVRRTYAYASDPATGYLYAASGWGGTTYRGGSEVGRLLTIP